MFYGETLMTFVYSYLGMLNNMEYFLVCKWKRNFPSIYLAKGSAVRIVDLPQTPLSAVAELRLELACVHKGVHGLSWSPALELPSGTAGSRC